MDASTRFVVGLSGATSVVRDDEPLYVISVAAEMAGMHPQTLRQYDRLGLVSPNRTGGGGRRYSLRDIELLREVQRLSQEEGVNLAGVKRIIDLERMVDELSLQVGLLDEQVQMLRQELVRRALTATPARALTSRIDTTTVHVFHHAGPTGG